MATLETTQNRLKFGMFVLLIGIGLRTYIEWQGVRRLKAQSPGKGLAESLPIKYTPAGDFSYIRIVTRGASTNDSYFEVDQAVHRNSSGFDIKAPGSAPPHLLKKQNRTLTVTEGSITYELNGEEAKAQAGQTVFVPQGSMFTWWLSSEAGVDRAVVRIKTEPAGKYAEKVYEALSGFSRDYGSLADTPFWQTMIWAARQDLEFGFLPPFARLLSRTVGAPLASVLGYEVTYNKYSSL